MAGLRREGAGCQFNTSCASLQCGILHESRFRIGISSRYEIPDEYEGVDRKVKMQGRIYIRKKGNILEYLGGAGKFGILTKKKSEELNQCHHKKF